MNYCPLLQRAKAGSQLREHRVQVRGGGARLLELTRASPRGSARLPARLVAVGAWELALCHVACRPPTLAPAWGRDCGLAGSPGSSPPVLAWRLLLLEAAPLLCPLQGPCLPSTRRVLCEWSGVAGGSGRHQEPRGGLPCPEIPEPRWVPVESCPGFQEGPVLWRGGAAAGSAALSGHPVTAWGTELSPRLRPLRL